MSSFGIIGSFDSTVESWTLYSERLEQFFVANEITDLNRRRAIFLTVIGPATYGLLRNLISPDTPTSRTLAQLIDVLNQHYDPVPSEIVERYKFNSRVRQSGESVAVFTSELRRLAKHCNYGATLDMMLRDRIVCGIQNDDIQRKLLSEADLTLARATDIAIAMEAAARNAVDLRTTSASSPQPPEVNRIRQGPSRNMEQENMVQKNMPKCYRCGNLNHKSADCRFRTATCHTCGKIGHISRICQSKGKSSMKSASRSVNSVQTAELQHTIFNLNHVGEAPPAAKAWCTVEGQSICFEVDSGAPFTLMPLRAYKEFQGLFPPLRETAIKLQSYTKHAIEILGITDVKVTFENNIRQLPLLVVKQGEVNLAGRDWIYPLGLMSVFKSAPNLNASIIQEMCPVEQTLEGILDKHKEVFTPGIGLLKGVKVHLSLHSTAVPKFFKARPVPYALREKVDQEIERLLERGILEPVKTSEWAAPIVPVLKQDGRIRICGDFKLTVNQATELEQYPLPKIEDLFAQLSDGDSFSKLDLQDAYCQLELDEESKNLVVINTQRGLFRYTRLPFGIASAPAIFQREMDKILQGQSRSSCYLDDLLVTGESKAIHLRNLDQVLTRLETAGMKLHPGKCEFLKEAVQYLGHRIDKQGLHPIESKVEAIEKAPTPRNLDELRSFIGLITYYAKFLPNMSTVLAPLYRLLKKEQVWQWTSREDQAFNNAKHVLGSSSLLVHFDNRKEVILACDASPYGLGAVLSHDTVDGDRPIAFASRSLTKAEQNYSQIEKETLALVFGVTRFRNYVLGRTFTLVTDHRPLINLLSESKPVPSVAAARIQRWALTLSAYAYKIKFRKGALHGNADACSRLPLKTLQVDPPAPVESVLLLQELKDSPVTPHLIATEIAKCSLLSGLRSYILNGWPKKVPQGLEQFWSVRHELSLENDIILRAARVFIPHKFRNFILDELHMGHQGISAIKAIARSYVWWPGMDRELESKVQSCVACQENASAPPAKHISWPVPNQPWERIHIDHAGPVEGHMLLVVVDPYSKWLEVIPVSKISSAITIVALRNLFARFGLPRTLVSDNGTAFSSAEFQFFLEQNGIRHIRTAPYHPNSNGVAERSVRTIKTALKKITEGTLAERLARFLFNYRCTPLATTGVSPATKMLGRTLRCRLDLLREREPCTKPLPQPSHTSRFKTGDFVWAQNFGHGPRWVAGVVLEHVGNIMLKVETAVGLWIRHFDQVRHRDSSGKFTPQCSLQSNLDVDIPKDKSQLTADTEPPNLAPITDVPAGSHEDNPPVLSPQGLGQTSDPGAVNDAVLSNPRVPSSRRSCRQRQPPRRLNL